MKHQHLGWILAIRKKHKQLEIEMKTLKKQLKHLFETRETAERQAHEAMERLTTTKQCQDKLKKGEQREYDYVCPSCGSIYTISRDEYNEEMNVKS